jgi:hypothetical protein
MILSLKVFRLQTKYKLCITLKLFHDLVPFKIWIFYRTPLNQNEYLLNAKKMLQY